MLPRSRMAATVGERGGIPSPTGPSERALCSRIELFTMRKFVTTAAVVAGSLILFVPLTAVAVLGALGTVWGTLGLDLIGGIAVTLLTVGFAYVTAMEIACVRLHGFDELHRGSRPAESSGTPS